MEKKTKQCPYCGEEILATAKKCKHCGEFLDQKVDSTDENEIFTEKVYTKDRTAKIISILCWGVIAGIFFIMGSQLEGAGVSTFFGMCCLLPIVAVFSQRFILEKDRIKIVKGIVFKKFTYIQYNKINDVELHGFSSTIVLFTGHDRPIKFSWITKPNEVLDFIQKKINK